jgi:hypothetical protein
MALVKDLADSCPAITIIIRGIGFDRDDPAGSMLNHMGWLNMKQNIMVLTGSDMISVIGNVNKVPTHAGSNADGSPPIELYATDARLNAKEFRRLDKVKCDGRSHVIEWHDGVGVHGSMWGVYVPPGFSLTKDKPMGTIWDKCLIDATMHASRTLMSRYIRKALAHPLMFPKDDFGDQCHDILFTSEECGCALLHNIMRLVHWALCDKVVDTDTPYQGNIVSFAAHAWNIMQYLAHEKLCGRLYTKYEALMMILETVQARFSAQMNHKAGLLFKVGHNKVDDIPFKLDMINLATMLTSWAKDLNLDVPPKGDGANHLEMDQGLGIGGEDNDVSYSGSDKQCKFHPWSYSG